MGIDNDSGYTTLTETFAQVSGINLAKYRRSSVEWKLLYLSDLYERDLIGLAALMQSDESVRLRVENSFTNNATHFFRDFRYWDKITTEIVPGLIEKRESRPLRVWSAGCSRGAEPYSLAIVLDEMTVGDSSLILATDIDSEALEYARNGVFQNHETKNVKPSRKNKYFDLVGGGYSRLREGIKSRVKFFRHDLLKDPYPRQMDLILCRNVLIHFTPETGGSVTARLVNSLSPDGVLVIGPGEAVNQPGNIGLRVIGENTYRKLI